MKPLIVFLLFFLILIDAHAEFTNKTEGGLVITSGNSRTQSIQGKHLSVYHWEKNDLSLKSSFLKGKSDGILNAKKWDASLRYERTFTEFFSGFLSQGVESDRFAGYQQRFNSDVGPKYFIVKAENEWNWFVEGGYRYSRERRTNSSKSNSTKGRVFTEVSKKWSLGSSSKLWMEYIPNFSNSTDWLFNSEFSTEAAIGSILSLRVAYLLKYDNQPNSTNKKKADSTLTTSLVASY